MEINFEIKYLPIFFGLTSTRKVVLSILLYFSNICKILNSLAMYPTVMLAYFLQM